MKPVIALLMLLSILLIGCSSQVHQGDLVLDDETLLIENERYIVEGDIILQGDAKLVIKDSVFKQTGVGSQGVSLNAYDNSEIIFENSKLRTSDWVDWTFYDNAKLIYNQSNIDKSEPWHSFRGNSSAIILGSMFGGTIYDSASFIIRDSPFVFIELFVQQGQTLEESGLRPGHVDKLVFPDGNDKNISYLVDIENSEIDNWGIGVTPWGKLKLKDSRDVNICMPIHNPLYGAEVYFDNLKRDVVYDYREIMYENTEIILENVSASGWCFNTWQDNIIHVSNSDIDDINHNGGNGKQYYENVNSHVAIAADNVYIEIKDSLIKGDAVAKDNSTIMLINTIVKGDIIESDSGTVIVE